MLERHKSHKASAWVYQTSTVNKTSRGSAIIWMNDGAITRIQLPAQSAAASGRTGEIGFNKSAALPHVFLSSLNLNGVIQ